MDDPITKVASLTRRTSTRHSLTRRTFVRSLAAAPILSSFSWGRSALAKTTSQTFQFSVLSLFKPKTIVLRNPGPAALRYQLDDATPSDLAPRSSLTLALAGNTLLVNGLPASRLRVSTVSEFQLAVPAKLQRLYRGTLQIAAHSLSPGNSVLRCLVGIERELAVASIVAAESPPSAPASALDAQAIATRSFLIGARHAHSGFDFCDTTHCQYLREPPAPSSAASLAAERTRSLVLYAANGNDTPFVLPAMYSRSCGGHTRTLAELGLPAAPYPYYSVVCVYCQQHPELWLRDASTAAHTERDRLAFNRIHGWSALPGNNGMIEADHQLHGSGIGHGLGLCQLGAADMAARGATFDHVLAHYYPNTRIAS